MKGETMNASPLDIPINVDSHSQKAVSWKVAAVLGAIVFLGSMGLAILVQEMIFDGSRSAVVRSADPAYRIQLLERAVSRHPGNAGAWLQLGQAYSESGPNTLAASAYESYLTLNPNNPDVWTTLGVQYAETDRPEKAIEAFDQALSLNPRHEASRLYKGVVRLNAFNDLRGAIRSWMQVLEANPDAQAPDGRPIKEWIEYCQAVSDVKPTDTKPAMSPVKLGSN
jgi:predicted Zn-dependent protease